MTEFVHDADRAGRIGLTEAIFCAGKSAEQIAAILDHAASRGIALLLTRLDPDRLAALPARHRGALDYDAVSRTAFAGRIAPPTMPARIAIVAAGTSDIPVAREAERTLYFEGHAAPVIADVGVAGLWRLSARLDELRRYPVLIAVAGMDAALPTVLGGLVPGLIVAVPTSVGYGVAAGGHAALHAVLASCAPGLTVTNIDNGYGAACAALRALNAFTRKDQPWNAAIS